MEDKVLLSIEDALAMLDGKEEVHAFVNPSAGILLGADWSRNDAEIYIAAAESRELAGEQAQKAKHGLAVHGKHGLVFFATKQKED